MSKERVLPPERRLDDEMHRVVRQNSLPGHFSGGFSSIRPNAYEPIGLGDQGSLRESHDHRAKRDRAVAPGKSPNAPRPRRAGGMVPAARLYAGEAAALIAVRGARACTLFFDRRSFRRRRHAKSRKFGQENGRTSKLAGSSTCSGSSLNAISPPRSCVAYHMQMSRPGHGVICEQPKPCGNTACSKGTSLAPGQTNIATTFVADGRVSWGVGPPLLLDMRRRVRAAPPDLKPLHYRISGIQISMTTAYVQSACHHVQVPNRQ